MSGMVVKGCIEGCIGGKSVTKHFVEMVTKCMMTHKRCADICVRKMCLP